MNILLNILREAQRKEGYLSESTLKEISQRFNIPLARLYGVVSFYSMLRLEPQGKHIIEICSSPTCMLNSGKTVEETIEKLLGIKAGETTKDGVFSFYKGSCIGFCDEAPAMLLDGRPFTRLTEKKLITLIEKLRSQNANPEKNPA